jgi:putative ABC transport system permease protein
LQSTLLAWREHSKSLEGLNSQYVNTILEKYPGIEGAERVGVQYVSVGYFRLLGVAPILGRHFVAEDALPPDVTRTDGEDSIIISHGYWQRRFGGDAEILGQTLDNQVVVGVMPAGFEAWPWNRTDIWKPIEDDLREGGPVGRLKPGVSKEQALAELEGIARGLDESMFSAEGGWRLQLMSLHESGARFFKSNLYLLMGAAAFVLLIACSNVASLLLGRAASRQREITTRAALGAGRLRLVRQMLTESIVLALAGGALGVLLARVGIVLFVALSPAWYEPPSGAHEAPLGEIHIDGMVLVFTLGLSLLTAAFFGTVPALRASKTDLAVSLKKGARLSAGTSRPLAHKLLVGSQIALTFVLLTGAALMINSLVRLTTFDRGFRPERLLTARLQLDQERYWPLQEIDGNEVAVLSAEVDTFYRELLEQLRAVPGVATVEVATVDRRIFTRLPGPPLTLNESSLRDRAEYREASPGFFALMGIPLLQGRSFTERDTDGAAWVAVINETMARLHFPNEDPIGKILHAGMDNPREIIGIVGDYEARSPKLGQRAGIYVPHTQHLTVFTLPGKASFLANRQLILETNLDPMSLAADVRRIVATMDPGAAAHTIETMRTTLDRTLTTERFWMRALAIFAIVALTLAVVGIYGVVAYSVAQRTHEIGVRMALGAQQADVLTMVMRQGMALSVGGVIVGLLGAIAATRLLETWLYEVEATDPATFAAVAVTLVGITLLATYIPARGATRVDPVNALRSE